MGERILGKKVERERGQVGDIFLSLSEMETDAFPTLAQGDPYATGAVCSLI
jgi:hypothetical protein